MKMKRDDLENWISAIATAYMELEGKGMKFLDDAAFYNTWYRELCEIAPKIHCV